MKVHEFTAHKTGASEEEGAVNVWMHTLGWTEESMDALMLQRAWPPEENRPGVKGVYIEIPIQRQAIYGGMTDVVLSRDCFTVRFDKRTAEQFGGFSDIVIHLSIAGAEFAVLHNGLQLVFKDCSCYREV